MIFVENLNFPIKNCARIGARGKNSNQKRKISQCKPLLYFESYGSDLNSESYTNLSDPIQKPPFLDGMRHLKER